MLSTINKGSTVAQRQENKSPVIAKPGFNPNFDGNLLAWYDGNKGTANPNTWFDVTNDFNKVLFCGNGYTLNIADLNGNNTLEFNGINQDAFSIVIGVIPQPITIYSVVNIFNFTAGYFITGSYNTTLGSYQVGISPDIELNAGISLNPLNPQLALNDWGIITNVFNGANSELRNKDNVALAGNGGLNSLNEIGIAKGFTLNYTPIKIAMLIIRTAADNTVTQNKIIKHLINHFGL